MIKRLRCKLDDAGVTAKGEALANKVAERRTKKAEAKNAASIAAAELKTLDEEILNLTRDRQDRSEERAVECEEIHDQRLGEIRVVRADTGEVIDRKSMTAEQRAANAPSKSKKKDPPAKKEAPN